MTDSSATAPFGSSFTRVRSFSAGVRRIDCLVVWCDLGHIAPPPSKNTEIAIAFLGPIYVCIRPIYLACQHCMAARHLFLKTCGKGKWPRVSKLSAAFWGRVAHGTDRYGPSTKSNLHPSPQRHIIQSPRRAPNKKPRHVNPLAFRGRRDSPPRSPSRDVHSRCRESARCDCRR